MVRLQRAAAQAVASQGVEPIRPAPGKTGRPPHVSLLQRSAAARLAMVLPMIAMLWLAVRWAVA